MTVDEFGEWLRDYMGDKDALNSHDLETIKKKSFEIDGQGVREHNEVLLAKVKGIIAKNDFTGVSWYIVRSYSKHTPYQLASRIFNYEVVWDYYARLSKSEATYLINNIVGLHPCDNIKEDFK